MTASLSGIKRTRRYTTAGSIQSPRAKATMKSIEKTGWLSISIQSHSDYSRASGTWILDRPSLAIRWRC